MQRKKFMSTSHSLASTSAPRSRFSPLEWELAFSNGTKFALH
jgi:hypothetical protein